MPKKIPKPLDSFDILMPASDQDSSYIQRFDLDALHNDKICLLHQEYPFPWGRWRCDGASPLFQFNLHYHEFLIPLALRCHSDGRAEDIQLFLRIVDDWINTCCQVPDVSGVYIMPKNWCDAWAPYTTSLRAINWLLCIEILGDMLPKVNRDRMNKVMYIQYLHLSRNLEKRVLANHYLENLKTLYILSIYFKEDKMHAYAWKMLLKQLQEQVLPSGLHVERSLMYHRILLESLMRCIKVTQVTGRVIPDALKDTVECMLSYTIDKEEGWNRTPLFNDSGDNVAKSVSALVKAGSALGIYRKSYSQMDEPGYFALHMPEADVRIIVDIDVMGPSYMMGHAHCDCLSFELAIDGEPIFVNAGTYKYQGSLRKYFRSTCAHNTAMIQNVEQARCWGEHRVAQSLHSVEVHRTEDSLVGSYKTWQGILHKRIFSIKGSNLIITDHFDVSTGNIISYLRIVPETTLNRQKDGGVLVGFHGRSVCVIYAIDCELAIVEDEPLNYYSPEFGLLLKAYTLEFRWDASKGSAGYQIVFLKGKGCNSILSRTCLFNNTT